VSVLVLLDLDNFGYYKPSFSNCLLIAYLSKFQVRRRGSTVFRGKQGFITLRDLFRWADRYSKSQDSEGTFFDWNQQLAEDGKIFSI
jgi:midasin (ATPase involved in ribosome maturation)